MEEGDAAVELRDQSVLDRLRLAGDDVADLGVHRAVEHQIDGAGADEHRDDRIHAALVEPEDDREDHDHRHVRRKDEGGKVDVLETVAQEFRDDIRTSGGAIRMVHDSETDTVDHAAVDRRQQGIAGDLDRMRLLYGREQLDENTAAQHSGQGGHQKACAELPPGDHEQRDVQHDDHHADGDPGEVIDDHRDTGDAASHDVVRVHEELKARGVARRADQDQQLAEQEALDLFSGEFFFAFHDPYLLLVTCCLLLRSA